MKKNINKNTKNKEFINSQIESVQTTIGDLIEAISKISLGICNDKEEAYKLTSKRISQILAQNNKNFNDINNMDA
ncbi:MAG: hypothetical protein SPJ04_02540 [Bdellovibrionota bacterium]|nr:hypothetical protein [Pseudomonadota bacterium]MDY6090117.1 hypothetical protein [Bdellovibrionota bacterium]